MFSSANEKREREFPTISIILYLFIFRFVALYEDCDLRERYGCQAVDDEHVRGSKPYLFMFVRKTVKAATLTCNLFYCR